MAASPLTIAKNFNPGAGTSRCIVIPTIAAATLIPTRAEIDAGDDVSINLQGLTGWGKRATFHDAPRWSTPTASKTFDGDAYEDSTLSFYKDRPGENNPVQQLGWSAGDEVFIAFMDHGDVATAPMDVYSALIGSITPVRTGTDALEMVSFGIYDSAAYVTIPAAA